MVTNFDYLKMNQNSLHLRMLPSLQRNYISRSGCEYSNSRRLWICCEMVVFCGKQFADSVPG